MKLKKIVLPVMLFLILMPFIVNAETCNPDKISISSITIEEISDNVTEIDGATASGKNINLNLSMLEVGDSISYKVVIKNDSNEDYELNKNSLNISSDYIDYILESEDNSNIIKANSSKVVYLKVHYSNEVPEEKFESGVFNDNKSMTLNLATEDNVNILDIIKNPKTGSQLYFAIFVAMLLISFTLYVVFRKKKLVKFMVLIIGTSIIIPISVHALCKCEISVASNVVIKETRPVTFYKQWSSVRPIDDYVVNNVVPVNDYGKYIDLYMTNDDNYDSKNVNLLDNNSLKKIPIIPEIVEISDGQKHPKSFSYNTWYKIIYNAPKYDENGNEVHYILKENHIYGLDLLGGDPGNNVGLMAFDPYDKNYNRKGITDEERQLIIAKDQSLIGTTPNEELYYIDYFPWIMIFNEQYLYGIGENETLTNFISDFSDTLSGLMPID